jgi:23S rRNA (uracil1939-C5)-methyltransferase
MSSSLPHITITHLDPSGIACGRDADGQERQVWGALPGEVVTARKNILEEIVQASLDRIPASSTHYLSCSPWQTMTPAAESRNKVQFLRENFQGVEVPADITLIEDGRRFAYRNKMEYSFWGDESGIHLAFFERSRKQKIILPDGCELANPAINVAAQRILSWIRATTWTGRNLKALILRANQRGEVIAALFIKDHLEIPELPLGDELMGMQVWFSSHKTPASRPEELLRSEGRDWLEEEIGGVALRYGTLSFFQVNVPIFERALAAIQEVIPVGKRIVDLYSGVGSIGLPVAVASAHRVTLVESVPEAVRFARDNAIRITHASVDVHEARAEQLTDVISGADVVIVDPPREGLHQDVVTALLDQQPSQLIYLSCNPVTQARDLRLLSESYRTASLTGYNFFPATPHVECLAVLTSR